MKPIQINWKIVATVLLGAIWFTSVALAAERAVTGTLVSADEGIVLTKPNGERFVVFEEEEGLADLNKLVGKKVRVTGRVEEGPYGKSIWVSSIVVTPGK